MAETIPTQVRLSKERIKALHSTAEFVGLTVPETHRKALDYGLPVVKAKLGKKK